MRSFFVRYAQSVRPNLLYLAENRAAFFKDGERERENP
jgi:hypothetical protein